MLIKSFWDAAIGSVLITKHKDDPQSFIHDKFAIVLVKNEFTVGHLPMFISKLAYFVLNIVGIHSAPFTSL